MRALINTLKAGMPWPEPGDGGWHWQMPAPRSMEKAREALGELDSLFEQYEALREAADIARGWLYHATNGGGMKSAIRAFEVLDAARRPS